MIETVVPVRVRRLARRQLISAGVVDAVVVRIYIQLDGLAHDRLLRVAGLQVVEQVTVDHRQVRESQQPPILEQLEQELAAISLCNPPRFSRKRGRMAFLREGLFGQSVTPNHRALDCDAKTPRNCAVHSANTQHPPFYTNNVFSVAFLF